MSEDITKPPKDPSGGFFVIPRRIPIGGWIVGAVVAVFGLGAWVTTIQVGVLEAQAEASKANDRVTVNERRWQRVERFMCFVCQREALKDSTLVCNDICGVSARSWRRQ